MFTAALALIFVALSCFSCAVDDEKASSTHFRPTHSNYNGSGGGYRNNNYRGPGYNQPYYRGRPNSRQYYNPYDFQQPYGSNPYSDHDQYYVPPNQYYNNEYQQGIDEVYSGR